MQPTAAATVFAQRGQKLGMPTEQRAAAQQIGNAPAPEVARRGDAVSGGKRLALRLSEHLVQLGGREKVILPLLAVAVGVLRAVKAAVGASSSRRR